MNLESQHLEIPLSVCFSDLKCSTFGEGQLLNLLVRTPLRIRLLRLCCQLDDVIVVGDVGVDHLLPLEFGSGDTDSSVEHQASAHCLLERLLRLGTTPALLGSLSCHITCDVLLPA